MLYKQKAVRTGLASARPAGAPPKQTKPNGAQPGALYAQSEDSDDETAPLTTTSSQLRNPGVPLETPPDCAQEYDNQRMSVGASAGVGDETPKVHESTQKVAFVMKNEKVNKWWRVDPSLLLYAPDVRKVAPFNFTTDELTIPNVSARVAMQRKLCKESPSWVASVAVIFKLPTNGKLDLPLSDAPGIVMGIPYTLDPVGIELEYMRNELTRMDGGVEPETVYGLLALGAEAIKTVYGLASQCPLPSIYDPTKNPPSTSTKFRVPFKLEDNWLPDGKRFLIGAILSAPPNKRASSKRPAESPPGGGGGGGRRADGKRAAAAAAAAPAPAPAPATTVPSAEPALPPDQDGARLENAEGTVSICGKPTLMKVFASKDFATSYAELRCKVDQRFTVCQAGPGKFILLLGPLARS